jgi:hypothetical protein
MRSPGASSKKDEALTKHAALRSAIRDLVMGYAASHKMIDPNRAALALSQRYPDCGLTVEQIVKEIEKGASENGSVLFTGRNNPERR